MNPCKNFVFAVAQRPDFASCLAFLFFLSAVFFFPSLSERLVFQYKGNSATFSLLILSGLQTKSLRKAEALTTTRKGKKATNF